MVQTYVGIENIRFDNKVVLHIDDYKDLKFEKYQNFQFNFWLKMV